MDMSQFSDIFIIGLCSVFGFALRLGKKFLMEKINPVAYIKLHYDRTIMSVSAIIASAVGAYMLDPTLSPLNFIMMAYMADSLVNKTPSTEEVEADKAAKM